MSDQTEVEIFDVGTQAIVENAKRLGLLWNLRMATITKTTAGAVQAKFDGDQVSIGMVNMTGVTFAVDDRVYVLIVPPSGNFIVGTA